MTYYRKSDNAKAQIVEHSPVTDSVYVQFDNEPPQIISRCRKTTDFREGRKSKHGPIFLKW